MSDSNDHDWRHAANVMTFLGRGQYDCTPDPVRPPYLWPVDVDLPRVRSTGLINQWRRYGEVYHYEVIAISDDPDDQWYPIPSRVDADEGDFRILSIDEAGGAAARNLAGAYRPIGTVS